MSEDLTRDPLLEKLSRFTPAASLDRDALIFAAGRASAPKNSSWKGLAGALALSQAATMSVWFATTRPEVPARPAASVIAASANTESRISKPPVAEPAAPDSYANLIRYLDYDRLPIPESIANPLPVHPVLSADLRLQEGSFD